MSSTAPPFLAKLLCFDHFDLPIRGASSSHQPVLKKSQCWSRVETHGNDYGCLYHPKFGVPVDIWGNQPNPFVSPSYENEGFVLGNAWAKPAECVTNCCGPWWSAMETSLRLYKILRISPVHIIQLIVADSTRAYHFMGNNSHCHSHSTVPK